jgi:hypothetical protein
MQFAVDEIGARRPLGLNLTVDATRLAEMRAAGFATREMDVLTIPGEAQTDYISASHFFEHLPDDDACARALAIMLRATRRDMYISGPHFDDAAIAREQGLMFFWDDWIDHTSRFGLSRLVALLHAQGIRHYTVSLGFPALTVQDTALLHIDEPHQGINGFDAQTCMPKWEGALWRPLYQEFALSIARQPDVDTRAWHAARHGPAGVAIAEIVAEYTRWPMTCSRLRCVCSPASLHLCHVRYAACSFRADWGIVVGEQHHLALSLVQACPSCTCLLILL